MKNRPCLFLLGLCLACLFARAAETRIELGGELNARWLTPEAGWSGRAVLILHGFASDSEGPADAQRRLAEALATRGIASLRVNFRGEGDPARTAIESTFDGRIADTETARAWLLAQPGVDPARLGVFGWSLGGATALGSAGAHPDWFRAMVLWSSVTGDAHAVMSGGGLAAAAAQAEATGTGTCEIAGWKTVTLRRAFFESFRGVDLDAALARHVGKFLSVRGSADYLPPREAEILKLAKGRPAEAILIGGADHIFNVFEPGSGHFNHAVRVTVDWLDREL
jgi:hypothetical protein